MEYLAPNQFHPAFSHYKDTILQWLEGHTSYGNQLVLAHTKRVSAAEMESISPLSELSLQKVILTRHRFRAPTVFTEDYTREQIYWEWFGTKDQWNRIMTTDMHVIVKFNGAFRDAVQRLNLPPYDKPRRPDSGLI